MFYAHRDLAEPTRGWVFIHACRRAFATHVENALHVSLVEFGGLARLPALQWHEQPVLPRHWRVDVPWHGTSLTLEALRRTLHTFPEIHYEVTWEPTELSDGGRMLATPELGTWVGLMDRAGNTLVNEVQLRRAMHLPAHRMRAEIEQLLGQPWDDALEPMRRSGDRSPAPQMHAM